MKFTPWSTTALVAVGLCPSLVLGTDVLKTNGFTTCLDNTDIKVTKLDISYDKNSEKITFDAAGSSAKQQNVTATLNVQAYGRDVYSKTFDPCADDTKVDQLCPIPAGEFSAAGEQTIPSEYASQIPSIAFTVPDLDGTATLKLTAKDGGEDLACIQSEIGNGKTVEVAAVSYAAAGIAGAALVLTGLSALGAGGHPGATTSSPSFGEVMGWFHSMATNGMLSVNYPTVYRSFTKNFAFSTGLIPWDQMQNSIDTFRNITGGNLTDNNYQFLRNATLVFSDGSNSSSTNSSVAKRALDVLFQPTTYLAIRDGVSTSVNGTSSGNSTSSGSGEITHLVKGIQSYAEQLMIPQANTFMTVLLIFAIVVAAIAVGILLLKVILEAWALFGSFPASLTNFRKDYWGLLARTITNLILVLYGIWVLYCVYQFTHGDSWAAKLLAGLTLGIFTAVLIFFTVRIWLVARKYKKSSGTAEELYENAETWKKYSLFYDSYKKGYWWLFVPAIMYMFVKGCILAGGDGHGLAQSAGQLIVEALMLILLLWTRPYEAKASRWINITIQVVRVLSVGCVLVFVEELGISQTTKTVTGVVLIAVQSTLTGILAILVAVNALIMCIRENPHARRRREAEKLNRDFDNLTPLDARNSLLMDTRMAKTENAEMSKFNFTGPYEPYRDQAPTLPRHRSTESTTNLIGDTSYAPYHGARSQSRESRRHSRDSSIERREPTLPHYGHAY